MVFDAAVTLLMVGFLVTGVLELLVLRWAHDRKLLAQPNERSSHEVPTPAIGGIAIALPVLALLGFLSSVPYGDLWGLLAGCGLVAAVSLWDDLSELSARLRLVVQLIATAMALTSLSMGDKLPLIVIPVLFLAIVWHTNLFNFMDGIDGYAASQCLFFALAAQWLLGGATGWTGVVLALLTGSTLGFLVYNWPKASIFMGDVGSSLLGLLIGILVVELMLTDQLPLVASMILLTGFWFDATYTLCVRMFTHQAFTQPHRSHLYQRLAQRKSHQFTTLLFWLHALGWLLPLSWMSLREPSWAWLCLVLALVPSAVACRYFRAGENQSAAVDV